MEEVARTQFEEFVRTAIKEDGDTERMVQRIADRWEHDTEKAREDGIVDGRESVEPEIVDYETIYRFSGD